MPKRPNLDEIMDSLTKRSDLTGSADYLSVNVRLGRTKTTAYVPITHKIPITESVSIFTSQNLKGYVEHSSGVLIRRTVAEKYGAKFKPLKLSGEISVTYGLAHLDNSVIL